MSFPRYPEYKDSGVEWLGEVPAHWAVMPIRAAARLESGHTPSRNHPEYWEDCLVPWFTLADVWQIREVGTSVVFETKEKISELGIANSAARRLPAGTVMLSRTASVGFAAIMGTEMATTQDFANWVCGNRLKPEYLLNVFRAMRGEFARLMMGSTHNTIYMPDLQAFRFVLPPLAEQDAIVAFLNRETAKIDALVAEQQRLIDLLREKRQAVVSRAVTKGLNPDAEMKESGLAWIGEMPAHWALPPLYTRYDQALGKMLDQAKMTGEWPTPYLRNQDVRWDRFNLDDLPLIDIRPEEKQRFSVRKGDLMMVEGRELGRCAIWEGEDDVIAFQKALHRLRPRDATECVRYFYYLMVFANAVGVFFADQLPNEIPHLTGEELRRQRFPKPPVEEQIAIAEMLDRTVCVIDRVIEETERGVELLLERRLALISAAVTGQIDVRAAAERTAA